MVRMYVCVYVAIRRPRVQHAMRVRILQLGKDRQRRSHANSNCSSLFKRRYRTAASELKH